MIKKLITLFIVLISFTADAQRFMVPYRVGTRFGLSDEKGKLVVPATYDNIEYLQGNYFQYTKQIKSTDSAQDRRGVWVKEELKPETGVYFNDKLIIKGEHFRHYLISPYCIAGSDNPYHAENCALFNMNGEKLINEPIKSLGLNEEREFGSLAFASENLKLISVYQRDENRNRIFSIAVYDKVKQKITGWLVQKVRDFKADPYGGFNLYSWNDSSGHQEKVLVFSDNKFKWVSKKDNANPNRQYDNSSRNSMDDVEVAVADRDMVAVEEAPASEGTLSIEEQEKKGYVYYEYKGDSIKYHTQTQITSFKIPEGVELFRMNTLSSQVTAVIYRKNNQFGLFYRGSFTEAVYDSLFYYSTGFIACRTNNNATQWGMLNQNCTEVIPFKYDSIPDPLKYRFAAKQTGNTNLKTELNFVLENANEYRYSASLNNMFIRYNPGYMIVYKNGKAGILNGINEIIVPIEYDLIAANEMSSEGRKFSKFTLLKKDNLYGTVTLKYNPDKAAYYTESLTPPVFKYIPSYYYKDYFGQKGVNLYALYDEQYNFKGFADEQGIRFYKD